MGAKVKSRIVALFIAVALIATSGIGVLAADSPSGGKIWDGTAYTLSKTLGGADWTAADNAAYYIVYLNGVQVMTTTSTHADLSLSPKNHYTVEVQAVYTNGGMSERKYLGGLCTYRKVTKLKAKRAGKKAIKVSWKKSNTKSTKHYKIVAYENGKYYKTYTVSKNKSSKKIKKLKKGARYQFTVYAVCKGRSFRGGQQTSKIITAK